MHILQGLLALLLLPGTCGAADKRLSRFWGAWEGNVTNSASGCAWDVVARLSPRGSSLSGTATYSGPCAKGSSVAYLNADRAEDADEDDCLKATIALPGAFELHGQLCIDGDGDLLFESDPVSGKFFLEKGWKSGDLSFEFPKGSGKGTFYKVVKKKAAKGARQAAGGKNKAVKTAPLKVKSDEKNEKPFIPEIFIGRN